MPELSSAAPAEEIFPVGSNTTRCSVYSGIGVQFPMDSVFSLPRNRWSVSAGIRGQFGPEYANMFAEKIVNRALYVVVGLNILACLLFRFFPKLPFFSVLALAVWSCVALAAWIKPAKIIDHTK
jgi:hypothetical protein